MVARAQGMNRWKEKWESGMLDQMREHNIIDKRKRPIFTKSVTDQSLACFAELVKPTLMDSSCDGTAG